MTAKTKELYKKIARAGGIWDARKYRYDIDLTHNVIRRTLLSNLDTTAMLEKDAWEIIAELD